MRLTRETARATTRAGRSMRTTTALAIASLAALAAMAAPAMASLKQDLQRFSTCPYNTPGVGACLYSVTTSGEFVLGNGKVPVSNPVIIKSGLTPPVLVSATDGETLSKTPLPVPGGLVGIELPGNFTEVTATAELAGTSGLGYTLSLPLKVKLDNLALGSNCYIGSNVEPIALNLTYATTNPPPPNKPISGSSAITTKDNGAIKVVTGTLVDNAFAAPGASGCTALPLVGDLAVNTKEGLPSAAGKNTAILSGVTELVQSSLVRGVLPLPDFGRCVKAEGVLEGKKLVPHGLYGNSTCTAETPEGTGKFEWKTGPGPSKGFSGAVKPVKLETTGKALVSCSGGSDTGEYTSPKNEKTTLTLTGCQSAAGECKSSGAAAGEIATSQLQGSLEFIKENEAAEKPIVGLDLKPTSGSQVAAFECGGAPQTVTGGVIAPVSPVSKMTSTFSLKAKATGGKQAPEAFEVGASDTLSLGGEQAGLTTTITQTGEEPLEIKAAS
ncbi:MAG: hypothetical protein H0X28_09105 [Solirubrobacterales bacterium]|nr:hypothetical protein [Solirubrobacterales bacterium]